MSDVEKRLWFHLRRRSIVGRKFRRQVPIGPFIADFACMSARLIIEVDGDQHGNDEEQLRDTRRTEWLEGQGWRVLRFWTSVLASEMDESVDEIYEALENPAHIPSLTLPHKGGGDLPASPP